jgi:hypothetical protein
MQHFFAQKYFDPDEYFRLGVRVPVPVVPVPGGSAAPMGYYREISCEWLDKESRDLKDEVTKAWKRLKKKVHRDPLAKNSKTKEDIDNLQGKQLVALRQKIDELTAKYREFVRAGLRDDPNARRLKKRAWELKRCYQRVEDRLLDLQKEISLLFEADRKQNAQLTQHDKRIDKLENVGAEVLALHLQQHKKMEEIEKAQAVTARELTDLKEAIATKTAKEALEPAVVGESFGESLLGALPYAIGSAACFAATYYLVPDEYTVLKFAGYAGGTALAGAALLRAVPVFSNMFSGMLVSETPELN